MHSANIRTLTLNYTQEVKCPETRFVNGEVCRSNPLEIFVALSLVSVVVVDWINVRCV